MHKLRALAAAVTLIAASLLPAQAFAAGRSVTTPAPVQTATPGGCTDFGGANYYHTGRHFTVPSTDYSGIAYEGLQATFNASSSLATCTGVDLANGTSLWVGIEGGPTFNNDAILQIGMILCHDAVFPACEDNTWHYFWADGGCNNDPAWPQDLGPVTTSWTAPHNFKVVDDGSGNNQGYWQLWYDGTFFNSSKNNGHINCWDHGSGRQYAWNGERWDGEDGLGVSTARTHIGEMYHHDQAWHYVSILSCNGDDGSSKTPSNLASCGVNTDHRSMDIWTQR